MFFGVLIFEIFTTGETQIDRKSAAVNIGSDKGYVFPDGSKSWSSNYCRNPTGDPTGAWCYTDGAETDLCDVPGCSSDGVDDGSGTLLTGGGGGGGVHWLHVLPEWRNAPPGLKVGLKRWAPGVHRGTVSLRFRRAGDLRGPRPQSYDLLRVGGEKIELFRARGVVDGSAPPSAELVYPHLVMASRWTELSFEFAVDATAAVVVSTAADGEILRWADNGSAAEGPVAFVGLSAEGDDYYVGARFPSEGQRLGYSE